MPRGTPSRPSGWDELLEKSDRQIERALKRAIEVYKRKRTERPGPAGGGWSWDVYEQQARRAMEDTLRRRRVPGTRGRRDVFPHPFPPPHVPAEPADLDELLERVGEELERPPVMPPLPRTAESRGFGDIRHSFPRPPPEPLPVPAPELALPPVSTPVPEIGPVGTTGAPPAPGPTPATTPLGVPALLPAAIAAASVFVIRSQLTRPRSQTTTPSSTPIPTPTPTATPIPTPTPTPTATPSSPPSSPPPPTLTPTTPQSVCSPCRLPEQQRKDDKRRREQKRKACRQFISIRVPAHKRKMCVQDFAKYLVRKLRRTATTAVRKRIIAELEKRGVPASRLRALTRKPRRPKAEVEVGGVEIDFEDLIGK